MIGGQWASGRRTAPDGWMGCTPDEASRQTSWDHEQRRLSSSRRARVVEGRMDGGSVGLCRGRYLHDTHQRTVCPHHNRISIKRVLPRKKKRGAADGWWLRRRVDFKRGKVNLLLNSIYLQSRCHRSISIAMSRSSPSPFVSVIKAIRTWAGI